MFQENFRPFDPQDLDRFLKELSGPAISFHPADADLRQSPRGYSEINQMYHRALFDRRGTSVRLEFNPRDPEHKGMLDRIQYDISQELRTLAQRYEIPRHGFSASVQDRSVIIGKGTSEYYLRVEVLDGNLRPVILTDGCVQSFKKAPVAFIASWETRTGETFARPMLTTTAFNEVMAHLRTTPLDILREFPTPNYAFLMICNAMQKYIDDRDRRGDLGIFVDDREYTGQYLSSAREYEGVAREISELEVTGGYYSPRVAVVSTIDGEQVKFDIEVKRHYNFGWIAAQVARVTPVHK